MLILDLKENLKRNRIEILKGNKTAVGPILDDEITENVIWSCTFCRSCESSCPVFIDHTDKVLEVRRDLVMMKSSFPDELQTLFRNLETYGSPWPFNQDDRLKWAEGLQVTKASEGGKTNLLLWVGCAGAFDERQKTVTRSLVSIFKKAGIQFSVLGDEETCTGDAARRLGNEYLFQQLAKKNVETLNKYDVKKIVTACPHCFNTLRNDYREFGGKYEVQHHTEFLADLISTGKIKPTKGADLTVTFHDPCFLGKWNGIYDQPRKTLRSLPSVRFVEMKNHHDESFCCGGGGGRMWLEEKLGKRINLFRADQVIKTRAGVVVSACPFCTSMLQDAVKTKSVDDKIKVVDIAELVDKACP